MASFVQVSKIYAQWCQSAEVLPCDPLLSPLQLYIMKKETFVMKFVMKCVFVNKTKLLLFT